MLNIIPAKKCSHTVDYDISRHDTVWVVNDQLRVVKFLTRCSVHTVTAIRRTSELFTSGNVVFLSREYVNLEHCTVCVDSLRVFVAI